MQDGLALEFSRAHLAAWNHDVDGLRQCASYDSPDKRGNHPIHFACESRAINVVEFLLDNGVSVNQPHAKNGRTPLHIAALFGNHMLINILVQKGAELKAIAFNGETPITLAERAEQPKTANYLRHLQQIKLDTIDDKAVKVSPAKPAPHIMDIQISTP